MILLNRRLIVVIGAVAALAGSVVAQSVVVTGTGDPDIDVGGQRNRRVELVVSGDIIGAQIGAAIKEQSSGSQRPQ